MTSRRRSCTPAPQRPFTCFFFVVELLGEFAAVVPNGDFFLKAAEAMKEYLSVLRDAPPLLPTPTFQKLLACCKAHLLAVKEDLGSIPATCFFVSSREWSGRKC